MNRRRFIQAGFLAAIAIPLFGLKIKKEAEVKSHPLKLGDEVYCDLGAQYFCGKAEITGVAHTKGGINKVWHLDYGIKFIESGRTMRVAAHQVSIL